VIVDCEACDGTGQCGTCEGHGGMSCRRTSSSCGEGYCYCDGGPECPGCDGSGACMECDGRGLVSTLGSDLARTSVLDQVVRESTHEMMRLRRAAALRTS
jgi:hypothetical protein